MPKKTTILIILLAIVTIVLVFFAITAENISLPAQIPTNETGITQEETIEKTAVVYFAPQTIDLSTSTTPTTAVDIMINTGENSISGVQTELQYDPDAITNVRLEPSVDATSFFGPSSVVLLNEVNPETGRISYATAIGTSQESKQGTGKIATLYFENAFGGGNTTTVSFLNKTLVTILGSNESVLRESMPLNITLSSGIQTVPPVFETLPEEPLVP